MSDLHIGWLRKAKASWLYPIYIPSYGRAGTAPLLNMLADSKESVKRKVHIIVRPEEASRYAKAYPWAFIVSERVPGIGPARMRALRDAERRKYKRIVVLDDDIKHVSLLERITREDGSQHTRRYSSRVSGIREPFLLVMSLAVGCVLAERVFAERPYASYGAARNALFSGDVDPSEGATINKGSFPACVMFFHVARYRMRDMPKSFQYHGEDLAMFLHAMEAGQETFTLPGVAYDQDGVIETTIPLDPLSEEGRPHLKDTPRFYPNVHPYLRVSMKNKLGGTMRIGVNWKRWYKDYPDRSAVTIPLESLL